MRSSHDHQRVSAAARTVRVTAVLVLAMASTGLLAGPAAAEPITGGAAFTDPVPLPLPSLNGAFDGSNIGITSARTESTISPPYWANVGWYSFTPDHSGTLTVTTAAHSDDYDTALEVWTAAGGFVGQNDDYELPTSFNSRLTVDVRAGTPYRLGLGSWGEFHGHGVATVTLSYTPEAPRTPSFTQATPGHRSAQVAWTEPRFFPTSYTLWCTPDGGAAFECADVSAVDGAPATATTITGLTNGVLYDVRVVAHNSLGASPPSSPVEVFPRAPSTVEVTFDPAVPVSGEPVIVVVTVASDEGPGAGTVDVTVGGTTYPGVPLLAGTARVTVSLPVGTYPVTVEYNGALDVAPGSADAVLEVGQRSQTVTLEPLPAGLVFGDGPVTLVGSSSRGLSVTFSADGACSVDGDQLTLTGAGECTVTAEAGDDQTVTASASRTVTIGKRVQTLDVTSLSPMVYGQDPIPFTATSSLALPVTIQAEGACAYEDGVVVATGAGSCTVVAEQEGDADTHPADVVQVIDVAKRSHTVSITGVPALITDNTPLTVTTTSDRGLPVTLTGSGACTIDGDTLVIVDVGACQVTATSAGDEVTAAAATTVPSTVAGRPAQVQATLGLAVGDIVEGATVQASGTWLRPGTDLTLTVYSSPALLGTDLVAANGIAATDGVLPALPVGAHRLVAEGVALDGSTVTDTVVFGVDDFGQVAWIGTPPALAASGADLGTAGTLAATVVLLGAGLVLVTRVARYRHVGRD